MTNKEKADLISQVIDLIKDDFNTGTCGKHGDITLTCISCQAAIVVSWLQDYVDLDLNGSM